jgi:ABC-type multidrug transport system fused ATPase/permease subunit
MATLVGDLARPYRMWLVIILLALLVETIVGLARNAPILILDEPTASLDSESERLVMEGLNRLMNGRTVIMITHRLNTIRGANLIIVLHDGIVAEQGTHEALLAAGGIYAGLYSMTGTVTTDSELAWRTR